METAFSIQLLLPFLSTLFGKTTSTCNIPVEYKCNDFEIFKSQEFEIHPFFIETTRIFSQCCSLCASIDKCASFNYDVKTHTCSLLPQFTEKSGLAPSTTSIHGKFVNKYKETEKKKCSSRPCNSDDVCVTTTSGNGYICLKVVDCGTPPLPDDHHVTFTNTTYMSSAVYQCGLGYYSLDNGTSVCQADGSWSNTCKAIPLLAGTRALAETSSPSLMCRSVTSIPVANNRTTVLATCNDNEILTGCSVMPSLQGNMRGSWKNSSGCITSTINASVKADGISLESVIRCGTEVEGASSEARCCSIPGLQCEYLKGGLNEPLSCFKHFQLLDCSCNWSDHTKRCQISMTNNTCVPDLNNNAYLIAVCCYFKDLICEVRNKTGIGNMPLTKTCENGETMTACSGYNTESIGKTPVAEITQEGTLDTCIVQSVDLSAMSTSTLYVTCCKYQQP